MSDHPTRTIVPPPGDSTRLDLTPPAPLAPAPDPPPGYEFVAEIGHGGMGVVYQARDLSLDRDVAVKLLQDRYPVDSFAARRFLDEARITGQLQHPGIPAVHQVGVLPSGRPFLAMKLIKGRTLDDLLKERADPSADRGRFLAVFEQVCQAVGYAHAHHVIHRDLKPANVMVGAFGEVQVMDWGLAKVLGADPVPDRAAPADPGRTEIRTTRESDGSYTEAGSLLGTPAYMPPEQAAGAVRQIDERADVFGLGAILCQMLTGQPPYTGADGEVVRLKAVQGKVAEAFERLGTCGAEPELIALGKLCLAAEPNDRPRDAEEVARAVADLRAAAEERARGAELDRVRADGQRAATELKAAEARKRHRVQLALAAVVLLAGVGAAAAGLLYERQRAAAEADRAARRARTASGVDAALADARTRTGEGWASTNDPPRMASAAAHAEDAVRRAEGLVATGEPDEATRAAVADARAAADDLTRHARLLTDAEQVIREHAQGFASGSRVRAQRAGSGRRLAAALRAFGLDPTTGPADEVGRAVAASRIRDRLVGYLREWEWWVPGTPEQGQVRAVLRAAMLAAGGPLARWQEALDRKDAAALRAVAASDDVLAVGPALITALGRDLLSGGSRGRPRLDLLRRAVDRYPDYAWGHYDLTHACLEVNPPLRYEALRHAAAAAALVPDSAFFQLLLAEVYEQFKAGDQVVGCLRKAADLDPRNVNAHTRLGQALRARGDLPGAEAALRAAVAADPDYDHPHFELGKLLIARGDRAGAAAAMGRAIDLLVPPASYDRYYEGLTIDLAVGLGRPDEALRLLTRLIELRPAWAANPNYPLRYNAACCAALASARADTPPAERPRLRRQAQKWLAADLAAHRTKLAAVPAKNRAVAHRIMSHWMTDSDLVSVRERTELGKLPLDERVGWVKLWTEVRDLRDATTPPETAPPPRPAKP